MPKVNGTRKQRAEELLARLQRGPIIGDVTRHDGLIEQDQVRREYRCWAGSWVLTELCQLVPELRCHLNSLGYFESQPKEDASHA